MERLGGGGGGGQLDFHLVLSSKIATEWKVNIEYSKVVRLIFNNFRS